MSKTTCQECKGSIDITEGGIQHPEFPSLHWHHRCFICHECKESCLQSFGTVENHIYCANHYKLAYAQAEAKRKKRTEAAQHLCHQCNVKITEVDPNTGKVALIQVNVAGRDQKAKALYFHPTHCLCSVCNTPLDKGYYAHQGEIMCPDDYTAAFFEKCKGCDGLLLPLEFLLSKPDHKTMEVKKMASFQTILNSKYHNDCICCYACGTTLRDSEGKQEYYEHKGRLYCRADYELVDLEKCFKCNEVISQSTGVCPWNNQLHNNCTQCEVCEDWVDPQEAWSMVNGDLRCDQCPATVDAAVPRICAECGNNTQEASIRFEGKYFHPGCFKCEQCGLSLNGRENGYISRQSGKRLCFRDLMSEFYAANLQRVDMKVARERKKRSMQRKKSIERRRKSLDLDQLNERPRSSSTVTPLAALPETSETDHKERKYRKKVTTIDYTKGRVIGKGAAGIVYLGINRRTGQMLAIKELIMGQDASKNDEMVELTQKEINLMRGLHHDYIVNLIGTDTKNGKMSILMEYVPGDSLWGFVEKNGASNDIFLRRVTKQFLLALAYLHGRGIMHRDLKARNLLFYDGIIKVCDFGSARHFDKDKQRKTADDSDGDEGDDDEPFESTPLWASPEACCGVFGPEMDIWAAGCTLIEMATVDVPWAEKNFSNNFRALYHIGQSGEMPPLPANMTPLGQAFLKRIFANDPSKRPDAPTLLRDPWLANLDDRGDEIVYLD